jgi:hydrophobe/amphiphile efflux-1 (HAE1) family protein
MNLIALSLRRTVFAWILMFALIVFGAISASRLGVSQLPDIDFPVLTISVNYEGASPEVVEADIVDPIEQQLLSIEGIKEMRSSVRQGTGQVRLEFDIDRDVDVALQEVQSALSQVRLPTTVDLPVVRKTNPEESPIMFIGVSSKKPLREVLQWLDTYLLDQFRFLPGVGEVSIGGFSERNLRIWPDLAKLKKADLTIVDLLDTIETQHIETAAGQYVDGRQEKRVRWMGEALDPEQFGELRILKRGGEAINEAVYRIKDVARVEDGLSDIRRMARFDDTPAIGIAIRKQRGGNEVDLSKAVRSKLKEIKAFIPKDYNVVINIDFTRSTEAVVHTTYEKLVVAAIVTIFICFLFLGSWQAALNILFSIPTSIVGTFIIVYFAGFTLNLFTLLALTLAISIVVDDAIMLLENIVRHSRMGKNPAQAAYDGAMEILPAATAATLAVVAVFLPVVFMSGVTGKFFFQFGVTMSAAVLLSLLEAVTITPMRSAAFLSAGGKVTKFEERLDQIFEKFAHRYGVLLDRILHFPKLVTFGSLFLFCLSLLLVRGIRQEFVPPQDQDVVIVAAEAVTGSSLEFTNKKAYELEAILKANPNVAGYFVSVGGGGPSTEVNQIFIPAYLKPRETRKENHEQVMNQLRKAAKDIKDLRISFRDISSRGLTAGKLNPVSFFITGPDLNILKEKSEAIIDTLNKEGLTQDIDTDFKLGLPEMLIFPDRDKMAARGVTSSAVARTLNAAVAGARESRFTANGRRYDVRVKISEDRLQSPEDIKDIYIRNNFGLQVPLRDLVQFKENTTYQAISRVNRQRAIGVFGNLTTGQSQATVLDRARVIAQEILPKGYGFLLEGSAAGMKESFSSLILALTMGILVAYMILAVQFNSFIQPISVLVALPFSLTGALLTLWLFGVSLNLFSFIGLIVLMGIAKKNSIMLVEFTNQVRAKGKDLMGNLATDGVVLDVREALVHASPVRLRPILMTSVATIGAAIPLVVGDSIGQETRTPMGLTIIGGTIISTMLTLFVVPSLYLLLSRFESKKKTSFVIKK